MKNSNDIIYNLLGTVISESELLFAAEQAKFIKRAPRKIRPLEFAEIIIAETQKDSPSYNDLAGRYEVLFGKVTSRQAFNKRFNPETVEFFKTILEIVISHKIKTTQPKISHFTRIIIQDSTIIRLPNSLYEIFHGVSNQSTHTCNARIQCVYDIVSEKFISFSIDSYSKNDASVADQLELSKNDLTIRDRGYFKTSEFKRHLANGSFCIYRYKYKTAILDVKTKQSINLNELLREKQVVDMRVCLNDTENSEIRLIATPVCDKVANQRRRRVKADCRSNPSKDHNELLGWSIFLTNIPVEILDLDAIFSLYSLRWRIEIIFKSWKSNMNFSKFHKVSEIQLRVYLYARFIFCIIVIQKIYAFYSQLFVKKLYQYISILKITKYLNANPEKVSKLLENIINNNQKEIKKNCNILKKYCCYDKRNRMNYVQQFFVFCLS